MIRTKTTIGGNKTTSSGIGSKIKAWFQQLSRGLMLPIAILPIAGLLLGIGGAIGANTSIDDKTAQTVAQVFKGMSEVVFANLPILFCVAVAITFSNDKGGAGFAAVLAYLVFTASQLAFIQSHTVIQNEHEVTIIDSIFWKLHKNHLEGIVGSNLGMLSLNTSIFGGLIIGIVTSYTFNYFSKIQLPTALSFFSGIRLVPIILVPVAFIISVIFLVFWPWIGLGIYYVGTGMQSAPAGVDGLIYGMLGRALMPFGLHHIPIVLAFQTDFGGVLTLNMLTAAKDAGQIDANQYNLMVEAFNNFTKHGTQIIGDQNIWNFINGLPFNTITKTNEPVFAWFKSALGVNAGRFTQDYPTYLGSCIGIGLAMILTSEKSNRKVVAATVGSAMVVAFLTGITEPLEFSFLFVAPIFYYIIYVPLSGLAYMFMILVGAHVGVGFARGFIDLMIYGALPVAKGTKFYFAFPFALGFGLITFVTFYFYIKKANLATPGRNGNTIGLIGKKQYQELKQTAGDQKITKGKDTKKSASETEIKKIIQKLGGKTNLASVSACATRLRITQKKYKKLNNKDFVEFGSYGLIQDKTSVQIIFGGKAAILADKINSIINDHE